MKGKLAVPVAAGEIGDVIEQVAASVKGRDHQPSGNLRLEKKRLAK